MRFLCAVFIAAFFAVSAHAEELKEGKDWRNCSTDDQCVLIDGICDKTAVNVLAKKQAEDFYKQERPRAECARNFWAPKERIARCHLGGCDTRPKQASDEKPDAK